MSDAYDILLIIRNLKYQQRYFAACYLTYPMTRNSSGERAFKLRAYVYLCGGL